MAYDSKGTLNKVMIIGRLGQDPELKYTSGGAAVCTLSVATNTSYKGQDGNFVENTEWNRVVLWKQQAENAAQYLNKGSRVYVEGRLQTRSWEKDGDKRYSTEIVADRLQFLDGKKDSGQSTQSAGNGQASSTPDAPDFPPGSFPDDDIPF